MSSYQFPLSRVSFSTPRLIPAGTSPRSIKWDTHSSCTVKITLDGDGSTVQLEVTGEGDTAMMTPRSFTPIATVIPPAVRKITYTEKQAAFRYDWPSLSNTARTQECFQMIFQDTPDLTTLIGHLSPFFSLQASTAKPITVTSNNASSQSQSSGSKSGAGPASAKAKTKLKSKSMTKPRAPPKPKAPPKPQASVKPTVQQIGLAPSGSASTPVTAALVSQPTGQAEPVCSSSGMTNRALPSSSVQPQQSPPPVKNLLTAELERKLLVGFVASGCGPSGAQGETAGSNPSSAQVSDVGRRATQTAMPNQNPIYLQDFPSPQCPPLQPQPQPQTGPAEASSSATRGLQRTPTVVDLIAFSPLIPSHTIDASAIPPTTSSPTANATDVAAPVSVGPPRVILGGPSDLALNQDAMNEEYPVMLTDEAEKELAKVKMEEEDLDSEPVHACPAMDAYGHEPLGNHTSHSLCSWTSHRAFPHAMCITLLYGPQVFNANEDELRAMMGEVMYDEHFAELCARVSWIMSGLPNDHQELSNSPRYVDYDQCTPCEPTYASYGDTASLPAAQASSMLRPFIYEYGSQYGYGHEEAYGQAKKRARVEDAETPVLEVDDLAEEEEQDMVDGYAL